MTVGAVLWTLALTAGCKSAAEHAADADREVYRIVAERRAQLDASGDFTLDAPFGELRAELLSDPAAAAELGPLDLADCLAIAAENSRNYRAQRESLYLAALDLTLERFDFALQKSGSLGALVSGEDEEATSASANVAAGLAKRLGSGALIVGSIGLNLFRSLLSSDGWDPRTTVQLSITQPLLAGAGPDVVEEQLTQAERNVLYAVRDYERFRRTFAVDVATRVYRILQQRDTLANEEANRASLQLVRERNEALAAAGRLSEIQVDQARQDELRANSRVIDRQQQLTALLDDFKIFLGLPPEVEIDLDEHELVQLVERGLQDVGIVEHEAVAVALASRLDHLNAVDRVDDAGRRVAVFADALRGVLTARLEGGTTSDAGQPLDFDDEPIGWAAGLDWTLPFERLPQRNAYRASLIALDAARRSADASRDGLVADLRDALRELESRRQEYAIQLNSVALAERRVESTRLNFEAGRTETRDLLEAQDALLEARNALTSALVDHRLAVLGLYRDMELLRVDEDGLSVDLEPLQTLRSGATVAEATP